MVRHFRLGIKILPLLRILLVLAAAVLLVGTHSGCGGESWKRADDSSMGTLTAPHGAQGAHNVAVTAPHDVHDSHGSAESFGAPTDYSIYHLDAPWTDQRGQVRQLASLGGRVQVVALVYTTCGYACPRIVADMKQIEAGLAPEYRDRVGFVMVSIDPERDTPDRLAAYAESVRLDPARWTLLTAPDPTVRELAALLGVKYRRIGESDFSHSNVITILDQRGEIAHRQVGLGTAPAETLRVIAGLLGTAQ